MERKILQIEKNGVKQDMMPIMDDLSIYTNGMTLREQIENIRRAIRVGELFLGAYESVEKLLEKYPNGSELLVGTYALVSDVDAFYVYDTDTKTWKAAIFSASGIFQLNGLTGTNGVLTITGGDINATVPSSDVVEQTISQHLEYLASSTMDLKEAQYNVPTLVGTLDKETNAYVLNLSANVDLKGKLTGAFVQFTLSTEDSRNNTLPVKYRITYSDGATEEGIISGRYVNTQLTRKDFKVDASTYYQVVFYNQALCSFIDFGVNEFKVKRYSFNTRIEHADGGYYTSIKIGYRDFNVLSFAKVDGNNRTSVVLDYSYTLTDTGATLYIYSDEQTVGEVMIAY